VSTSPAVERYALVIGNNKYQNLRTLRTAAADAEAIADLFTASGISVTRHIDATQRTIRRAASDFAKRIRDGKVGIFWFSGHGVQLGGKNVLLPIDAEATDEYAIADDGIDLDDLIYRLADVKPHTLILIIDACRKSPFSDPRYRALGLSQGLANPKGLRNGVMVVYAAGADQVALDHLGPTDTDPNSLFTREVLPLLPQPGVPLTDIIRRARTTIHQKARGAGLEQTPAIYDQLVDSEFILIPSPPASDASFSSDDQPKFSHAHQERKNRPSSAKRILRRSTVIALGVGVLFLVILSVSIAYFRLGLHPPGRTTSAPAQADGSFERARRWVEDWKGPKSQPHPPERRDYESPTREPATPAPSTPTEQPFLHDGVARFSPPEKERILLTGTRQAEVCGAPIRYDVDEADTDIQYRQFLGIWTAELEKDRSCIGLVIKNVTKQYEFQVYTLDRPISRDLKSYIDEIVVDRVPARAEGGRISLVDSGTKITLSVQQGKLLAEGNIDGKATSVLMMRPPDANAIVQDRQADRAPPKREVFLIYFDWGSDTIGNEGEQILQQAVDVWKSTGKNRRLNVTGYTDRSMAAEKSQQLSEQMSKRVANALEQLGIPRTYLVVSSRGENDNRVPTADGVQEPQNRRVEIVFK
jgi:outer membrane protein OmpA-like peptidoglycan-associated protein